jgi:oxygen-independent coproporphyrinogen-3 oxidase
LLTSALRIFLTRSFKPFVFHNRFASTLDYHSPQALGLYVHIPFCRSVCSFCPYCKELYDQEKAQLYRAALLQEIELVCRNGAGRREATSLYFGGGTPVTMIEHLPEIIDHLGYYFKISGGIGVELHPDDISPSVLQKLEAAGVNMVSVGFQSFNDNCLEKLGRSSSNYLEKMALVREGHFHVIDVDLIFAIPGQNSQTLTNDLATAFLHGATQVSTYPFIEFSYSHNNYKPMPAPEKKKMLQALTLYCRENNLERTSVWTFARPGTQQYSSVTREAYLGFCLSAATLLPASFKINSHSLRAYIDRVENGLLPTSLTLDFSPKQKAVYHLFWSAYNLKFNREKFYNTFGTEIEQMFGPDLHLATRLGFINRSGDNYLLTDKGINLFHDIEQIYTTAYIDKMWNTSRRRDFPEKMVLR